MNNPGHPPAPRLVRGFYPAAAVLVLAYAGTLYHLCRFCLASDLYSYVLLIPFVSAYLASLQRPKFPLERRSATGAAVAFFGAGGLAAVAGGFIVGPAPEDLLAVRMTAFLLFFAGLCALFLGRERLSLLRFPLGLLVFMIPLPAAVLAAVETFLQYGSADAANVMFTLSGMPVFEDGLSFQLPGGIKFNVKPECSGIHSSVVLLITSLVAVHLLLRTPWKQALLVLTVIPLALVRNGFRIFVIGRLCVHYGPQMFESWVHRHGGPLFFALSLIPFFGLLLRLIKSERTGGRQGQTAGETTQN